MKVVLTAATGALTTLSKRRWAETIFRAVAAQLGIRSTTVSGSVDQSSIGTGGSDGPPVSSLIAENGTTHREASDPTPYVSLDARWDGVFPPRPPRPEDIVIPTDAEDGAEPLDLGS
ncbi:unnamed protein product [Echinostoma caproni]|uniref:Short chain dehydrogenase n=1 Tax=Echinostoma caproni TaxID=27848 RepID=A0A183AES9_9TREM|nr:unnamed protein product [Echinostoma caproni]